MDAGDIFSLVWCCGTQTIIFGCQNTSIQWFDCTTLDSSTAISPGSTPLIADSASVASVDSDKLSLGLPSSLRRGQPKVHKFFDSYPQSERKPADEFAMNGVVGSPPASQPGCVDGPPAALPLAAFDIPPENEVDSAHYGYVYAMVVLPSTRDGSDDILPLDSKFGWHLVTGSGDETIKVSPPSSKRSVYIDIFLGLDDQSRRYYPCAHLRLRPRRCAIIGYSRRYYICWLPGWIRHSEPVSASRTDLLDTPTNHHS